MKKFKDAFEGLVVALKHKAVLIQFILAFLAILGGFIIKLDKYEWLAFIICIGLVLALEIANTCIEYLCNYIRPEYDEKIKDIKNMSASFVLVGAIISLIVCIVCVLGRII